ncbi:YceI family protein [Winogradskyella vincentii]|uniref:YceI family protein n=1 Tax=Winogradskyella vincentii TaxID=2877122 RepID=A0ABS7Y0B0_9FLAO|nr:YceI family protein [Winogradskyella vincentii]MCA0153349.1 YceI family protein [Winogradskyella vincentii]
MRLIVIYTHYLFLLFIALSFSTFKTPEVINSTIQVYEGSYIKIKGTSNVNEFDCVMNMVTLSDSLLVSYSESNIALEFDNTELVIPNKYFNCGGRMINKDFHRLLNTDRYPDIKLKLKKVLKPSNLNECVEADLDVEICGVKNSFVVPVTVNTDDRIRIQGIMSININDFKLEPPKKLLGVIKVSPVIEIDFQLNYKVK